MRIFRKYYQVFSVTLSELFVWKLNFVLWRFRVVLGLLLLYFLWSTVFLEEKVVFGYEGPQIITYVLLVSLIRSFVLSSRVQDIAGDIRDGDLTNLLLRPVSSVGWWWSKDLADKLLNVGFVILELGILYLLFKPDIVITGNITILSLTILTSILGIILYFYLSFLISLAAFWMAEVWGIRFLTIITLEFLAGGFFPLDILPESVFRILQFTPFPYLLFFPAKIYLGQLGGSGIIFGVTILLFWIIFLFVATQFLWLKGLRGYSGEGR